MKLKFWYLYLFVLSILIVGCSPSNDKTAAEILGNPEYLAFSYGGYRGTTRDVVPTVEELKEDMKILEAMGVKLLRTYNSQQFAQAGNLLKAIQELKEEDRDFEMYVMLGVWIDCEGAWTETPNHNAGSVENNTAEINAAVEMAMAYPDIVKIIAVGNEAMVHWATRYFVSPAIILKWVEYLQDLKSKDKLPENVWITSSDNFAAWGGDNAYRTDDLAALIKAVDYVSLHTYPFHESHYNSDFWNVPEAEDSLNTIEKVDAAMIRAIDYAKTQYQSAADYIHSVEPNKPIHIGETGWASVDASLYGANGSHAADEYKQKLFYDYMRDWTNQAGMSCFYFEAFDEHWKDQGNPLGSENHFGLISLQGEVKFALWDSFDYGVFEGLTRNGVTLSKTYNGDTEALLAEVLSPPSKKAAGVMEISMINNNRQPGDKVIEDTYVVLCQTIVPDESNNATYPSAGIILNSWEGTCSIKMSVEGIVEISNGTDDWWGCALELPSSGVGENMTEFANGLLNFAIKGNISSDFSLGFQTGLWNKGNQVNNFVTFSPGKSFAVNEEWTNYSIPVSILNKGADLTDVTSLLFLRGESSLGGKKIFIKDIYYSRE
ncbi:MAG: hypothetical protein K9H64_00370 [Bacteroidales bacterium]|nr:hypothetical protein [Bacteroidales bacterium]MCF8454348.1 hypothetical protein [Bacteroidales bacterium]